MGTGMQLARRFGLMKRAWFARYIVHSVYSGKTDFIGNSTVLSMLATIRNVAAFPGTFPQSLVQTQ